MIMGTTLESNRLPSDQDLIYELSNNSWEKVTVIDQPDVIFWTMFGNSVTISKNLVMVVPSTNVYAYDLENDFEACVLGQCQDETNCLTF